VLAEDRLGAGELVQQLPGAGAEVGRRRHAPTLGRGQA
jgi:hypothetical protein